MSIKRKSFLLHIDSLDVLDDLTDEQAGKLFKAMKAYHCGEEMELDPMTKIAFSFFKNQFARDQEKYEKTCKARAEAGSKGGKQKVANANKSKQKAANVADSDSKNKNKSDSDSKNKEIYSSASADAITVLTYLNEVLGTKYKHTTTSHIENINARLKDHSIEDAKLVIDHKFKEWGSDNRMAAYLRPQTLFGTKFEGYLLAARSKPKPDRHNLEGIQYTSGKF